MNKKKILVIYKKSALQLATERKNAHVLGLLAKGDPSVASWQKAHEENEATLVSIRSFLDVYYNKSVDFRYRAQAITARDYSLVITVGGDGTFLWASKFVGDDVPMLGVNSDPSSSVGYYTCCSKDTFVDALSSSLVSYLNGEVIPREIAEIRVPRISVEINGTVFCNRVLNDILFAAKHPAAMTKYDITTPEGTESQKSSGIWISTPTGSTASNLSAGGIRLDWHDDRIQYVVREPYLDLSSNEILQKHTHGFICDDQEIRILNKTRQALVCVDGTSMCADVEIGDIITLKRSSEDLVILGK